MSSSIYWASGDVGGSLRIGESDEVEAVPWTDLEDIALAFDALFE